MGDEKSHSSQEMSKEMVREESDTIREEEPQRERIFNAAEGKLKLPCEIECDLSQVTAIATL